MMRPEALRDSLRKSLPGRLLLWVLSWLYGAGVLSRRLLYRLKVLPARRLPARTVCIGNLTTGGTGKTSAVLLAAHTLRDKKLQVAVLSRGYGRPRPTREVQVLLDQREVSWQETGDEPWMMHHALRGLGIPILVSADRYRAGMDAMTHYDPHVILLDDGFQHHQLQRDLDILLVNAKDPFGGGRLLPLGGLREPLSGLRRAGLIVVTHADEVPASRVEEIKSELGALHPDAPIVEAVHRPDFLFDLRKEEKLELSHLEGRKVSSFCALGDPSSFEAQLEALGAKPVQNWRFPDHHPFTPLEIRSIGNACGGMPVVTTFKDVPRLPPDWKDLLKGEVLALGVRMEITKGKKIWESRLYEPAGA